MKSLLLLLLVSSSVPKSDSLDICFDQVYIEWNQFDRELYLLGIEDSIYNDTYNFVLNGFSENDDWALDPNSIRFGSQTYGQYAQNMALNDSRNFSLITSKCPMKQILRVTLFHDGNKYQLAPTDLVPHFDEESRSISFIHSSKNRKYNLYFFYPHKPNRIIAGINFEPMMPLPLFNTIAFNYFEEFTKKIEEMIRNGGRPDDNSFEKEEKALHQISRYNPDIIMIDVKWDTYFFIKDNILFIRYYSTGKKDHIILPWEQAIKDNEIGPFLDNLARNKLDNLFDVKIWTE